MTATLELFKNLPFDGVLTLPKFSSLSAQNTYFDSYTDKISISSFRANKIMEPILVSYDYDTLSQYPYGRIKFNSVWYYFTVTNLDVVGDSKVSISYVLDCFTTAYMPYGLSIRNCHVTRRAGAPDKIPYQGIEPICKTASHVWSTYPSDNGGVFFTATKENASGVDELVYCMIQGDHDIIGSPVDIAEGNTWDEKLGIQPSTIKNVWYVPDYRLYAKVVTTWTKDTYGKGYVYYTQNSALMPIVNVTLDTMKADDMHDFVVLDAGGSIVYTLPRQVSTSAMTYALEMTTNTCYISVTFASSESYGRYAEGLAFKIPCKQIDFFIDAYSEYASGFRQIEIENRKIQNEKALVSGLASTAQTAGFGAVGGGPAGAVAGAAAGIVSATAQYALNYAYEGKEQELVDRQYKNSQDSMVCFGNSLRYAHTPAIVSAFSIYELDADSYSIGRYNAKTDTYGYDVNEYFDSITDFMTVSGYYAFECEVRGNVLMDWKNQIASKFANGIRIVIV